MTISDGPINLVDWRTYPLHDDHSAVRSALVYRCRSDLDRYGMFDLVGLMQPAAIAASLTQVRPTIDGLDPDHAARREDGRPTARCAPTSSTAPR